MTDVNTIVCEVKSSGPYQTSIYYKFLQDTNLSIEWEKYLGGEYEIPGDISSWKNIYSRSYLCEVLVKKDSIVDILDKFTFSKRKPLFLKQDGNTYELNTIGTSSDKYHITISKDAKYEVLQDSFVGH